MEDTLNKKLNSTSRYNEKNECENTESNQSIIDDITRRTEQLSMINGIVVGVLINIDDNCVPLVDFPMNPTGQPLPARSTVALEKAHLRREVALMFEQNDMRKPIVIGLMHAHFSSVEIEKDGSVQEISAQKELSLRCGKASILLREDGKIVIKGEEILSRARRTNKVKGGTIQLN
jgi:hypothetical protein